MSKLPHAPLVEVIFEIRWNSTDRANLEKFQLLIGSMFTALQADFPNAVNLRPDPAIPFNAFIGVPTHRFTNANGYPMYQLGPGVLSVNMIDPGYDWDSFMATTKSIVSIFEQLSELSGQKVTLALKYLDFFKVNFSEIDLLAYIKKNFHLSVEAPYLSDSRAKTFSFATTYAVDMGTFAVTMNTGYNNVGGRQIEGIITESNISKEIPFEALNDYIASTLPSAHELLGQFFKELTKGELYDSFK